MRYASIVIDLVIAVIVGAVSSIWADGAVDFLIGLTTFFAIETARLNIRAMKIDEQYQSINTSIDELRINDKFSEVVLLYGLRSLGKLSKSLVSVEKDQIREFWRNCIARATNEWRVITYALPEETWTLAWADEALAVQYERIRSGCNIERVFLVRDVAEKERLKAEMEKQKANGVHVYWLLLDDLLSHSLASERYREVGTLDVAVVDNKWVYRTILNKRRKMVGANATRDEKICRNASELIKEAKGLAIHNGNVV